MENHINSKIHQKFLAEINGVKIDNEQVFYTVEYLLESIAFSYDNNFSTKLVEDLVDIIKTLIVERGCDQEQIEMDFCYAITNADNFKDLKLENDIYGEVFNDFYKNLQNDKYI